MFDFAEGPSGVMFYDDHDSSPFLHSHYGGGMVNIFFLWVNNTSVLQP